MKNNFLIIKNNNIVKNYNITNFKINYYNYLNKF